MQIEELKEIATRAARPAYTDIAQASAVILAELTYDTVVMDLEEAVTAVCAAVGVQQAHDDRVELAAFARCRTCGSPPRRRNVADG